MKRQRFLARLLGIALGTAALGGFASEAAKPAEPAQAPAAPAPALAPAPAKPAPPPVKPPDEAKLRASITKSLAFLAKAGDDWMAEKSCNSCHHVPMLLWSQREAKQRGFPVDPDKFQEWLFWANESAAGKSAIGHEMFAYLMLAVPDNPAGVITQHLLDEQKVGPVSLPPAGMSVMQLAEAEARVNKDPALRPVLLLLTSPASAPADTTALLTKAALDFQKKDAPKTMESLLYRTLYARHSGNAKDEEAWRAMILKNQRGDGGWSEVVGANQSDPLGTGRALYVLRSAPHPEGADAIARAQLWLVKLQREDGTWPIDVTHISRLDRSAADKASSAKNATRIYTYWSSAWATLGLLQAFPVQEGATPGAAATTK